MNTENKETGIDLITKERQRQISVEGYDKQHDADHDSEELAMAAVCYALPASRRLVDNAFVGKPVDWPWYPEYWKPTPENRIMELVKAGALIAAEIDRLKTIK